MIARVEIGQFYEIVLVDRVNGLREPANRVNKHKAISAGFVRRTANNAENDIRKKNRVVIPELLKLLIS